MVDEFMLWFKTNEQLLRDKHVLVKVSRLGIEHQPFDKANAGLETETVLASFTVWSTGALEIIILNKHTEEEVVVDDRQLQTPKEMLSVLDYYCNLITR